ncbi:MAG: glycosyltransferase [Oscillospiraceae bacterium]|nr:glycosyltransferase [Oscillospiraceae bacterium]
MFLSFIVPVYNAAAYLPECLDSLLDQGISADSYEIICVNDGSRDHSLEVLQTYARKHPNIVIIDKENGGVTTARNAGLEKAQGDYIWFVDSDDFLKRQTLPRLQKIIQQTDCDRLIIGCYIFDDALTEEELRLSENCQLPLNGPGQDSICVRSLMRRAFLKEHNLFFCHPELTHGEDGLFMYEVCAFSPSAQLLDEAIYFYRIHSGSAETADTVPSLQKKLLSYTRITRILAKYYQDGRRNTRTANAYMTFLWFSLLTCACLPPKESREARKELKREGLFPGKRLPECDLKTSYMVSTESLVGKIYDKLYLNLHTPWGYAGIWLIRQLLRIKRSLK